MRQRTPDHWDDAIQAVIDARNHAPLPQIQRDILFKLTLRLQEEGLLTTSRPGNQKNSTGP
jgi:hypothetical protein